MASRSNACSELTRFWLEARHGCLVTENVPVAVPFGQSDIDIVALKPNRVKISLPDGTKIGPRLIVETKDEHDFDPSGREFGKMLRSDVEQFGDKMFIPRGTPGRAKFSLLREAHFDVARQLFGSDEFDRLFVVHAIDAQAWTDLRPFLTARRIYWLTIRDVVRDLSDWYRQHERPSGLRHSLVGDLWHLLVGYCGPELSG